MRKNSSSSSPPGYSYSVCFAAETMIFFFFNQKSVETEMDWGFKLLSSPLHSCLVIQCYESGLWQELLQLMLVEFTHDTDLVFRMLKNKCRVSRGGEE